MSGIYNIEHYMIRVANTYNWYRTHWIWQSTRYFCADALRSYKYIFNNVGTYPVFLVRTSSKKSIKCLARAQ